MGCKKQGAKNRVIVIQKEKRRLALFFASCFLQPTFWTFFTGSQTDPCFQNKNIGYKLTGRVGKYTKFIYFEKATKLDNCTSAAHGSMNTQSTLDVVQVKNCILGSRNICSAWLQN